MSDARWFEITADIESAVVHFGRAVEIFAAGGFGDDSLDSYKARMALLHAMQSGHISLESALLRVLNLLGEEEPSGRDWHADLIRRAAVAGDARPAILPGEIAAAATETRRFRHVATRS